MADQHGGARSGSGRKPRAIKNETAIERAERQIKDRLPEIVDAQITLALGVKVSEPNPLTGEEAIYKKAPDGQAARYLTDRIMGKPTERQEITGKNGKAIAIKETGLTDDDRAARIAVILDRARTRTSRQPD